MRDTHREGTCTVHRLCSAEHTSLGPGGCSVFLGVHLGTRNRLCWEGLGKMGLEPSSGPHGLLNAS